MQALYKSGFTANFAKGPFMMWNLRFYSKTVHGNNPYYSCSFKFNDHSVLNDRSGIFQSHIHASSSCYK